MGEGKLAFPGDLYGETSREADWQHSEFKESKKEPCYRKHWKGANFQKKAERRLGLDSFAWEEEEGCPTTTFDCLNIKYKLLNTKHKDFTTKPQHTSTASAPSLWSIQAPNKPSHSALALSRRGISLTEFEFPALLFTNCATLSKSFPEPLCSRLPNGEIKGLPNR